MLENIKDKIQGFIQDKFYEEEESEIEFEVIKNKNIDNKETQGSVYIASTEFSFNYPKDIIDKIKNDTIVCLNYENIKPDIMQSSL